MGLNIDESQNKRPFWPVLVMLVGLIIMVFSVLVGWRDVSKFLNFSTANAAAADVTVRQSINNEVQYKQNSFFGTTPSVEETAYIMPITDKINTMFRYQMNLSKQADLTYTYDVSARVHAAFSTAGTGTGEGQSADVWTKTMKLVEPVTTHDTTSYLAVSPRVEIPFNKYRQMTEEIKNAYTLALTNEAIVTFTIRVDGTVDGTKFSDKRTSTVSFPLDQQVYRLTTKYDGQDKKKIELDSEEVALTNERKSNIIRTGIAFAVGLGLVAFAVLYGLRRKIFKNSYQRELDRIYRYHNGIIVKAGKEVDLEGKDVVVMQSFDDLLNLEEELKTPIVASRMGDDATRFMIMHNNVVYAYTLGKVLIEAKSSDFDDDEPAPRRGRTSTRRR